MTDDDLITRPELLRRVNLRLDKPLHERALGRMETAEIIDRPIRRWHDGAVRALYPPYIVDVIVAVKTVDREELLRGYAALMLSQYQSAP